MRKSVEMERQAKRAGLNQASVENKSLFTYFESWHVVHRSQPTP
jgi:hypothetical protein